MNRRRTLVVELMPLFALAVAVGFGSAQTADAGVYKLNQSAKNRVEFHSKATLESFDGKAKKILAEFEFDPVDLANAKGTVTVDLRTLDTGIELRNKHMRENHLHTDSFPDAVFVLDSTRGAAGVNSSGPTTLTVHGTMTIHGRSRTVSAPATLDALENGAYRLQTEFPLTITDYGIPRPEFLFLKLAEEVKIIVDLHVTPATQ